jgi:hypothetical protein
MLVVTGVFRSRQRAQELVDNIREAVGPEHIAVLTPGASMRRIHSVPTTSDMPPVGKYLAATLGAALGLGLGATLFLFLLELPLVVSIPASLVVGLFGALAFGLTGENVDDQAFQGVPADELFVYQDALRKGRSVVIVRLREDEQLPRVQEMLASGGAETIDPARSNWQLGLGSAEDLRYEGRGEPSVRMRTFPVKDRQD